MKVPFYLLVGLLCAGALNAAEIAAGSMLGPRYKADRFYVRVSPTKWEETYRGSQYQKRARGKLIFVEAPQGLFEDEWLKEEPFDPAANTESLIAALDLYKSHGVLGIGISLQGADPGYSVDRNGIERKSEALYGEQGGARISAFAPDGSLKPGWTERLTAILEAADSRDMFVRLTYFHPAQDEILNGPKDIVAAAVNATRWLVEGDHRNVLIDLASGWDVQGEWDHSEFIPRNVANLIGEIREEFNGAAFSLPIGASSHSSMLYPESLAQSCDVVLLDGAGMRTSQIASRLSQMSHYRRPLAVVSDSAEGPAFQTSSAWSYNPRSLTQYFPFAYVPSAPQDGAESLRAALGQAAAFALKKPPARED